MQPVGKILHLARYPAKSMRGESLPATTLTLQEVPEDRRYAFVQAASRSAFPWLTARQLPDLLRYKPTVEVEKSGEVVVTVTTPSGEKLPIDGEELRRGIETRSGRALFLLHDGRGSYDAAPISLISRQTVTRIAEESGTEENAWRFRPNLMVDLQEGGAFEESNWVGRVLRVGDAARVAITEADQRCVMITLDPESAKSSPSILRCVVQRHDQCAGVYGTVLTPGGVHPGDAIWLEN
jgi:uncharacterized protein YcbX